MRKPLTRAISEKTFVSDHVKKLELIIQITTKPDEITANR